MNSRFRHNISRLKHELSLLDEKLFFVDSNRRLKHEAVKMDGRFDQTTKRTIIANGKMNAAEEFFVLGKIPCKSRAGVRPYREFGNIASTFIMLEDPF
jgi:hypothetical protein